MTADAFFARRCFSSVVPRRLSEFWIGLFEGMTVEADLILIQRIRIDEKIGLKASSKARDRWEAEQLQEVRSHSMCIPPTTLPMHGSSISPWSMCILCIL